MFIHSLATFFTFTSFISPIETALILLITIYTIYILTPAQTKNEPGFNGVTKTDRSSLYMYIQSAWLGRQSLASAFFPLFIILNIALLYADYRSNNGSYTIASWLTILFILALPTFWWTVSVWRCSENANRFWAVAARFFTVAVYYEYILRLIIGYYYPQIWFNCQQLIMEFGDCL